MKILTIIQARISSTRLPAKIMLDLAGKPIILRMIERLKPSKLCGEIIIATTNLPIDNLIRNICKENNIECYSGHPTDLLDRHMKCANYYNGDLILKIPSDCPLIDYKIVDKCILKALESNADYTSNIHSHNYPDGQDVEVIKFDALKEAFENAKDNIEREHTTPYIWSKPDFFKLEEIDSPFPIDSFNRYRLTLDYIEDYWLISEIFKSLNKNNFSLKEIVDFLDRNENIRNINNMHHTKAWYKNSNLDF